MEKNTKKCPDCGKVIDISRFPIKGQPEKTLRENSEEGTINWLNLFKIDLPWLIMILAILMIVYGFQEYNTDCLEIQNNPANFCEDRGYEIKYETLFEPELKPINNFKQPG